MAIRNDFAPGEVLAAADLNDTFGSKVDYPSGGADGDALIKDGTSAVWGAAGALTLITSESFSAVSSVSVNGCFTSTYQNYRILISATSSADNQNAFRLRASGSDNSTANSYTFQDFVADGNFVGGGRTTGTSANFARFGGDINYAVLEFTQVAEAKATGFISLSQAGVSGGLIYQYVGRHNQTVAYDGFTIFPPSGTITGTLRVYGYRN
jgi:hypothetical protein